MSDKNSLDEPTFEMSPFLKIIPRAANSIIDDPSDARKLPVYEKCTCGSYDKTEFVNIDPSCLDSLPKTVLSVDCSLTLMIVPNYEIIYGVIQQKNGECLLCSALFLPLHRTWLPERLFDSLKHKFEEVWLDYSATEGAENQRLWPRVIGSFSNNTGMYNPQLVPELCDLNCVRSWIHNCTTQHACCPNERTVIQGMHLIDCQTQTVCEAESSSIWVALSYVWGHKESVGSSTAAQNGSDSLSYAPKTIKDAMAVTLQLGYRHLWVDAYCIDQAHGAHKADQISKMDQIYRGAEVTLVATGSDKHAGLSGISTERKSGHTIFRMKDKDILYTGPDPNISVQESEWWSRGWTFQEGYLSRRLLVFGKQQMTFYCNTSSWMEGLSGPETVKNPSHVNWEIWSVQASLYASYDSTERFNNYTMLVEQYTSRNLRYESDTLAAFAGIAHHFRTTGLPIYSFAGLPYIPSSDSALRERMVVSALSFELTSYRVKPERRLGFSSWTWAGWKGCPYWRKGHYFGRISWTARYVGFESTSSSVSHLIAESDLSQNFLDGVCAIHLEAPLVPLKHQKCSNVSPRMPTLESMYAQIRQWCFVTEADFSANLEEGVWSCIMLGHKKGFREIYDMILLFVQWQDEHTAVRVGLIHWSMKTSPLPVNTLEYRKFRLV